MRDADKTKEELINELSQLRRRIAELEAARRENEDIYGENEHFLQSVFNAIQDGISILDSDLNIVRVNRWMERMYAENMPLVGRKCYTVYQRRRSPCPWCPTISTIETGEMHTEIVPYPSADDPTGWIELSAFPLKDAGGNVRGVIEHVKDVTQRVKAMASLRESEEKYHLIVESANSADKEAFFHIGGASRFGEFFAKWFECQV